MDPRLVSGSVRGRGDGVWLSMVATVVLAACHPLRPLAKVPGEDRVTLEARCGHVFPPGPWEAVHVIEASLPMQHQTALLGAVSAEGPGQGFRSVLMAQEGLALFDASYRAGAVEIHRALPPFDHDGFGEGTVEDIRLILFPAEGELSEVGWNRDSLPACRWVETDGTMVEVAFPAQDRLAIRRFDARGRLQRTAVAEGLDACGFAREIDLEAAGTAGYHLHLSLVERMAPHCSVAVAAAE